LIFIVYIIHKRLKIFRSGWGFPQKESLELFLYSLPLLFSGLLFIVMTKVDVFMIGFFLTEKWVGIYNIAIRIGTLSMIVLVAIRTVFSPVISRLFHDKNMKELENLNKTITKWIFSANLVLFFLVLIFNTEIMEIFGNEFLAGSLALIMVTGAQTIRSSIGASGLIIMMTGHSFYDFIINLLSVLIHIVLNLILIPKIGINGAAIAILVSFFINSILKLLFVLKVHKIHPYSKEYFKVIVISIIPFVVIFSLKNIIHIHWIVFVSLFLIIYGVIYFFLGLSKDDKIILEALKRKWLMFKKSPAS
jgi:O-antigen/teichoic acid export membrane protein